MSIALLSLILGILLAAAVGLTTFFLLQRMFRNRSPKGLGTCGKCGYSVEGLAGFTCPECGSDLRTVGIIPGNKPPAMRSAVLAALITLGLLMTCCFGLMLVRLPASGPAPAATPAPPPTIRFGQPQPTGPAQPAAPATQPLPDVE